MLPGSLVWLLVVGATVTAALPLAWLTFSWWRFVRYHEHKGLEAPRLGLVQLGRYGLREARAVLTLGWWHVRAFGRDRLVLPHGAPTGPPVVCVHGLTQNGSNLWGIRRALRRQGRATRAVSLGWLTRPLLAYVPPLVKALRETIAASPDGAVDVVAHSMGGVVLRMALSARPELAPHLRRVVTLGSPHAGTAGGRGLRLGPAARELGTRSPLFRRLPSLPESARLTTIATRHDLVVYPQQNCHLTGSTTIELAGIGHNGLLTETEAIAAVVKALCEDGE